MDIMDLYPDRISPEPNSGCWLWTGSILSGYGGIWSDRKWQRAHRFSYEFSHGQIPTGLDVLHKCDVKSCVNPAHLEVGTHKKNMQDAYIRGMRPTVATPAQVAEIRRHLAKKQPYGFWTTLAAQMNLSTHIVYDVRRGRSWMRD